MVRAKVHNKIYFWLLVLLAISIPVSEFIMSAAQIFLTLNWIIEGNFKQKYKRLKENKIILYLVLLYFLHLIWLINTKDFDYALHDLKMKLPLLSLPFIIGTSNVITLKELKTILFFFVGSVFVASIIIFINLINLPDNFDPREASIFISHIRFSLMSVFSIFILAYYIVNDYKFTPKFLLIIYFIAAVWIGIVIYLLKSYTGITISLSVALVLIVYYSFKIKHLILRLFVQVLFVTLMLIGISLIINTVAAFNKKEKVDFSNLEKYTESGNKYMHDIKSKLCENGHYIWLYYCEKELRKEWNKRSSINFDSTNSQGFKIKNILVRYMSSKGLRKDSSGVASLSDADIRNVENGMANYIYENPYSIKTLIYHLYWQIHNYMETGYTQGSSLMLRFEYVKTALNIISENFWFGTGTGDVKQAFKEQYIKQKTSLPEKQQRRTHNQYLTVWVSFGLVGFVFSIIFLFAPFILKRKKHLLFIIFFIIITISMFTEDTLENQAGITFFTFFYCIFVVVKKEKNLKTNG
ncbi:MAG: hypothetical protein Kow0068_01470 [Marinilabiliales bacterium]